MNNEPATKVAKELNKGVNEHIIKYINEATKQIFDPLLKDQAFGICADK